MDIANSIDTMASMEMATVTAMAIVMAMTV